MWYYYEICGKAVGPVSEVEILKLFSQRTVGLRTRIWPVGEKEWVRFEQTQLIWKALPIPQTPPPLKADTNPKAKSRIVFVILAILLGPLGIHNFYIRDKIRGGFQLCAFMVIMTLWILAVKIDSLIPLVLWIIAYGALIYWGFSDAEKVRVDGEGYPLK